MHMQQCGQQAALSAVSTRCSCSKWFLSNLPHVTHISSDSSYHIPLFVGTATKLSNAQPLQYTVMMPTWHCAVTLPHVLYVCVKPLLI
jgi:hypothetical protein